MALGMIECYGFTTSVIVADAVAKAGDVRIVALDHNKPANAEKCAVPLVMIIKFEGSVAAVEAGLDAGVAVAKEKGLYITSRIISRQAEGTEKMAKLNIVGRDKLH